MKWPFVLRSTMERALADAKTHASVMNWCSACYMRGWDARDEYYQAQRREERR